MTITIKQAPHNSLFSHSQPPTASRSRLRRPKEHSNAERVPPSAPFSCDIGPLHWCATSNARLLHILDKERDGELRIDPIRRAPRELLGMENVFPKHHTGPQPDTEELDLLVKWLGPESATRAKRIRSVHVTSPDKAVETIWQRLEDCDGCPEVIQHARLKRLEDFPRVSNKDPRQLRAGRPATRARVCQVERPNTGACLSRLG